MASQRTTERALIYKVFAKTGALFGDEAHVRRSHIAKRYEVNRMDMLVEHTEGDRVKLALMRDVMIASFIGEGWTPAPPGVSNEECLTTVRDGWQAYLTFSPVWSGPRFDVHGWVSAAG